MKKNNIIYLPVGRIQFTEFNPRKTIDETALNELAASIREHGVIQPIVARLLHGDVYEVVCGERRLRASILAHQDTIPAIVRELTDDQALDMAITENLQRKDVDPQEEAAAFKILIEKGQTISDLATRFGKSDIYIRGRLKLNDLIPEFVGMIRDGKISISQGLEICKYGNELQQEVYKDHYVGPSYNFWHDCSVKELKRYLLQYQTNLEDAVFDKTDCFKCPDNTGYSCLFPELEKVSCNNRGCFKNKCIEHRKNEVLRIIENEPEVILFSDSWQLEKKDPVVAFLLEKGASIACREGWDTVYELEKPEEPKREDYDEDEDGEEEYQDALKEYLGKLEEYEGKLREYQQDIEVGKIRKAFVVSGYSNAGKYQYIKMDSRSLKKIENESGQPSKALQLAELREKDTRNNEIAFEKTIEECKKIFTAALDENKYLSPMSEVEEKMLYFHMLDVLRASHRKLLSSKSSYFLSEEEKFKIIENLTEENKVIILRDFLFAKMSGLAYKKNQTGEFFITWLKAYEPEKVAEIELKHQETYLRRKEKIDARIAEIELENAEEK